MIPNNIDNLILESWNITDSKIMSFDAVLSWIKNQNEIVKTIVKPITIKECSGWHYDNKNDRIRNNNNSFFEVIGFEKKVDGKLISQPIILQDEIGYLGIACSIIDGVLYFLMQAKIEPGNINCVQLSPTIQATKSNYTQKHGGKCPNYYDVFDNAKPENILCDQIESEQSSRFLGKRNRNIIVYVDDYKSLETFDTHRWMTLGQIKKLMSFKNYVNMDTRTVLSTIPFYKFSKAVLKKYHLFSNDNDFLPNYNLEQRIFSLFSDIKMSENSKGKIVPLTQLNNWTINDEYIKCKSNYSFEVRYFDIEIENREVKRWCQPLIVAKGKALFALAFKRVNGQYLFLVKTKKEIGSRDSVELGPTIQNEFTDQLNEFEKTIFEKEMNKIAFDNYLSEEGGRFYHEENRNIIFEIDDLNEMPSEYFWIDFITLNHLISIGGFVNIQLRNLTTLLEAKL